jgi:hypothetical protein
VNPQQKEVSGNNAEAHIHGVGLFLAIGAIGLSLLSTGLWVATMVFAPQIIESKIQAAIAPANERSRIAAQDAAIAKNTVQKLEARLNERR